MQSYSHTNRNAVIKGENLAESYTSIMYETAKVEKKVKL